MLKFVDNFGNPELLDNLLRDIEDYGYEYKFDAKVELGEFVDGEFTTFAEFGSSSIQSVRVDMRGGDGGVYKPGCTEPTMASISILSSELEQLDEWETYAVRVSYDLSEYGWADTSLGVFFIDTESVSDDKLFTSFTAYDCMYFLDWGNITYDSYKSASGPWDIWNLFAEIRDAVADKFSSEEFANFKPVVDLEIPQSIASGMSMSFNHVCAPQGTIREVLRSLSQMMFLRVECYTGTIRFATDNDVQCAITVKQQEPGSLSTNKRRKTKMMSTVIDVDGVQLSYNGKAFSVDEVVSLENAAGSLAPQPVDNGGYYNAYQNPSFLKDGVPADEDTSENIILDALAMYINSTAQPVYANGIEYYPYSVSTNRVFEGTPGDWIVVGEFNVDSDETFIGVPVVDVSYVFDGAWSATLSAAAGEYDSDQYYVDNGIVKRVGVSEPSGTTFDYEPLQKAGGFVRGNVVTAVPAKVDPSNYDNCAAGVGDNRIGLMYTRNSSTEGLLTYTIIGVDRETGEYFTANPVAFRKALGFSGNRSGVSSQFTATTVTTSGSSSAMVKVPIASNVERYGTALSVVNGDIVCANDGMVRVNVMLNITATADGDQWYVQLLADGTTKAYALTRAAGQQVQVNLHRLVTVTAGAKISVAIRNNVASRGTVASNTSNLITVEYV